MTLSFTILGCGSSGGVPRIGGDWGLCDPYNPKNRRRRCSLLVENTAAAGSTRVLVDTSPDLRDQMLSAEVSSIDAVWYTHEHADHTHGIDELRAFYLRHRKRVPIWADASTSNMLNTRFAYCFVTPAGSQYPPIAEQLLIEPGRIIDTLGAGGVISGLPFSVQHGESLALGFRFGNVAYTPDLSDVPEPSLPALKHLDLWIVDALKRTPHPSHFSLAETLVWIERLKPKQAVLTNMHVDMDYQKLCEELPEHVRPAFDGMVLQG
jgi:phosphoribosyl 1,2-cyclic phosphate phosphodiesterase